MGNILLLLAVLTILKTVLMDSLLPRLWHGLLFGAACGLFVWLSLPYAVQTNKIAVDMLLYDQSRLMDLTLLIVLDLLWTLLFCARLVRKMTGGQFNRLARIASYIPSLLVFPALYYLLLNAFFLFIGVPFEKVTGLFAVGTGLAVGGGCWLIRKFIAETEIRIEFVIALSCMMFALVVCCTVFHPSAVIAANQSQEVDWHDTLFSLISVLTFLTLGFLYPKLKQKLKK